MKKVILIASALVMFVTIVDAKEKDPRVLAATSARDAARRSVLEAQVSLARAKAKLAEAQLGLTQAKYDAGATAAEAERE